MSAAALLTLPALPALAQSAGQTIDVGGWKVERAHNADGSFKRCTAVMEYDDKSTLAFSLSAAGKVSVVLVDPALKFTEGQTYRSGVHVDKGAAMSVDAIAADATSLVLPIPSPADDALMAAAMAGNALFIEAGGKVSENPLTGSGKAITQLAACGVAGLKGT